MNILQVCRGLLAIKGHAKMFSFITRNNINKNSISSFEEVCNWHAAGGHDTPPPPELLLEKCSFYYHKPSLVWFQRILQDIQPTSQVHIRCNHASPGLPHPAFSPERLSEKNQPNNWCNIWFFRTKTTRQIVDIIKSKDFHCHGSEGHVIYFIHVI